MLPVMEGNFFNSWHAGCCQLGHALQCTQSPFGLLSQRTHCFTDTWFKFGHFFGTSESHPFPWASFMSAHSCSVQQPIAHLSHSMAVGHGPGGHSPLGAQRNTESRIPWQPGETSMLVPTPAQPCCAWNDGSNAFHLPSPPAIVNKDIVTSTVGARLWP